MRNYVLEVLLFYLDNLYVLLQFEHEFYSPLYCMEHFDGRIHVWIIH